MDEYIKANIVFSKFSRIYMDLKRDLPIRPSEMGVLNIIIKRDGLFTPIKIAELLEVTRPMVTNHISVLESKGYITRQYLENDGRSYYVIPTDKARKLVENFDIKLNNKFAKLQDGLGNVKFLELINLLEQAKVTFEE